MPDITISQPHIGLQAYFSFKEPVATYVKNKLNTTESSVNLTVTGVSTPVEMIQMDFRDPFQDVYIPAGIDEYVYREDIANSVPILTFKHVSEFGKTTYFRTPLNHIGGFSLSQDIVYTNKTIVIDLSMLPKNFDTTVLFEDLSDFIETRTGVIPEIAEVSIGEPLILSQEDHDSRETVRSNTVSVFKTKTVQLEEMTHKYDQILLRLQTLNISLG